jgi:competence protein ComEA
MGIGAGLLLTASLLYYFFGNGQQEMLPVDAAFVKGSQSTDRHVHLSSGGQGNGQQTANKEGSDNQGNSNHIKAVQGTKKIVVDIKGAVAHPGVYTLDGNARLFQLVGLAGGLLSQADTKQVNEAAPLQDGSLVYIPIKGEAYIGPAPAAQPGTAEPGALSNAGGASQAAGVLININRATLEELQKIPGIGPGRAASILQYRQEHNGFKTVDDLRQISGIGPKTLEKLKPKVCVQ